MAKHLYKKGNQYGKLGGRPRKDPDVGAVMKINRTTVEACLAKYLGMPLEMLAVVMKDTTLPNIEHMVARIIYQGIKYGDQQKLNFLLERIVGKVRDQIEHTVIKPTIIERLDGSEVQIGVIEGDS